MPRAKRSIRLVAEEDEAASFLGGSSIPGRGEIFTVAGIAAPVPAPFHHGGPFSKFTNQLRSIFMDACSNLMGPLFQFECALIITFYDGADPDPR